MACTDTQQGQRTHTAIRRGSRNPQYGSIFRAFFATLRDISATQRRLDERVLDLQLGELCCAERGDANRLKPS